jgi:hypothetical protein
MAGPKRRCTWDDGPNCPQQPTRYVNVDHGVLDDSGELRVTGESFETLCDSHDTAVRSRPGFRWSRPLGLLP